MRQEDIVNEIRRMCGKVNHLHRRGWIFMYNNQMYVYVASKDNGVIRFSIPFATGIMTLNNTAEHKARLARAVNATNRNVKFVKAMLSEKDETRVSLDYTYKTMGFDQAKNIVPHIIKALDFATSYLIEEVKKADKC